MSTPNIHLRPIEKSDFEALYAVDQACFPRGVAYSRWDLRWFMTRRGAFGYAAQLLPGAGIESMQNAIVGFILAWESKREGHIITLDVVEPYRRQSIGTLLMQKTEEDFNKAGIEVAVLEVSVSNLAAQAFYQKFGYKITERLRSYYPSGEDAFEMACRFEDFSHA